MSLLDPLMLITIQNGGVAVPRRKNHNFVGFDFADDETTDTTTITAPDGGSGGIGAEDVAPIMDTAIGWSPVDYVRGFKASGVAQDGFDETVGTAFLIHRPVTIMGARFYWVGGAATLRVSIFLDDSPWSRLATKTIAVSAAGIYTVLFDELDRPVVIDASGVLNRALRITMYNTTGTGASVLTGEPGAQVPDRPFYGGGVITWLRVGGASTADTSSTNAATTGEAFAPIEPILASVGP